MYEIIYYLNESSTRYESLFNTVWGAVFKARCITESYGICTDVVDTQYGNILANFAPDGSVYADSDLPEDIKQLIYTPIE